MAQHPSLLHRRCDVFGPLVVRKQPPSSTTHPGRAPTAWQLHVGLQYGLLGERGHHDEERLSPRGGG